MAEVQLNINNKTYPILCEDGQEQRIEQLAAYIDQRVRDIASSGAASSDNHLLVLTALILTDEVFELRDQAQGGVPSSVNDQAVSETLQSLANRIAMVSGRLKQL